MFAYGITTAKAKEIYPEAQFFDSAVRLGQLIMSNFPSDCGALLFSGCNQATPKQLKAAMEIASLAGMSKIFGTIVMKDESLAQTQKDIFVNEGFQVIAEGCSNRNPTKKDIVLFHYNTNPKKKGY